MSLRQFLTSRVFFRHIIFAIVVFAVLLFVVMKGLKIYTHHGQSYPVPDFAGMNVKEAENLAIQNNFRVEILDSVYVNTVPPGSVVDQVPEAGFHVKENRLIYITINSTQPEQVQIPKLTDISFRQAKVLIENGGLSIGTISYEPSEFNDLVLRVQIDSTDIAPGMKVVKGTSVDLIIGRNQGNTATPLPLVKGLNIEEAENTLINAMLNPGVIIYDETILNAEDSLNAKIWQQRPDPRTNPSVNLGTTIDLWVTVDSLKYTDIITEENL